jgi:predicted GNAT family N-acyltransferase
MEPAVAWVDGTPIATHDFQDLLTESHGLAVLEQMVSLSLVESAARTAQIEVSPHDVQREFDNSLIAMARRVSDETSEEALLKIGRVLLQQLLRDRNLSMAEYMNGMERNVYLRKITSPTIVVSDEDIDTWVSEHYGRKAVMRHIELSSLSPMPEIRARLADGVPFSEIAAAFSENPTSARLGGQLPPFTKQDPGVPQVMRDVAFKMTPGQVSNVVRIENRHHLLRLDTFIEDPAPERTPEIRTSLRREVFEARQATAMKAYERRLFNDANIQIQHPTLRRLFVEKFGAQRLSQ